MINERMRTRSGTMPMELQEKVDNLLEEFMAAVDNVTVERHLQKGIARSQLPCSMVAILDKKNLFIIGQFRTETRFSSYIHTPESIWSYDKIKSSAQWEFGLNDPFVIEIPSELLEQDDMRRREALFEITGRHVDAEFNRFVGLLSLFGSRPIYGPAPAIIDSQTALLLLPSDQAINKNFEAISKALESNGIIAETAKDIRNGKSAVKELWLSINRTRVIIADLTGPDPTVMYGLGIAHTVGKETILICPEGSKYLVDIPKIRQIEYQLNDIDKIELETELSEMLKDLLQLIAET
ncbi:MAG: hypothetical protein MUO26_08320 [Methanotrichaceae archaeon]|nr:hypothetical protein [Methanotrichaceae archaeon]